MTTKMRYLLLAAVAATAATGLAIAEPRLSVNEIMVSIVTPATNTLWGADDPKTDAEWQSLEEAAIAVIAATTLITDGAAGPSDKDWAAEPGWQGYAATMMKAAEDARAAAKGPSLPSRLFAPRAPLSPSSCPGLSRASMSFVPVAFRGWPGQARP